MAEVHVLRNVFAVVPEQILFPMHSVVGSKRQEGILSLINFGDRLVDSFVPGDVAARGGFGEERLRVGHVHDGVVFHHVDFDDVVGVTPDEFDALFDDRFVAFVEEVVDIPALEEARDALPRDGDHRCLFACRRPPVKKGVYGEVGLDVLMDAVLFGSGARKHRTEADRGLGRERGKVVHSQHTF